MDNSIDRVPVNQLPDRYNLVRSAIYTRLDALGIEPEKVGNKSYVNAEQLRLLDNLHEFIQAGGTTAEFQESRGIRRRNRDSAAGSSGQSAGLSTAQNQSDLSQLLNVLSDFAAKIQPSAPQPDPFAYLETLERAAQSGWLLRTSEVAELLRLSPAEMQLYGDRFSEAGFVFVKAGYRSGGELAWRVTKPIR